jgi:membrane protein DedA with SNARE-associated domain
VGTGLWSALLVYLGWLLGKNYEKIAQYVGYFSYTVAALAIAGAILWVIRKKGRDS